MTKLDLSRPTGRNIAWSTKSVVIRFIEGVDISRDAYYSTNVDGSKLRYCFIYTCNIISV